MRTNSLHHLLRAAALSAVLIVGGATTALADVPGYDFPDEWQPRHAPMQMQMPAAQASAQNSRAMADACMPAVTARAAINHLPPGATPLRSGS